MQRRLDARDDHANEMMEYLQGIPHVKASLAMNREALTERSW
ncbi:MAG: hypothetical protein RXR21_06420 [Nitrososphaeria archaeon]